MEVDATKAPSTFDFHTGERVVVYGNSYPPDVDLEVVDDLRGIYVAAAAASLRGARGDAIAATAFSLTRRNGPKSKKRPDGCESRRRRKGTPVSDRLVEIVHPVDHVPISSMKSSEVRQVLVARDPGPRARPL